MLFLLFVLGSCFAQSQAESQPESQPPAAPSPEVYEIEAGRRVPLTFLKGVSTKTAQPGDPVYLETLFPILAQGRIAIPRGSYVTGSIVESKRAGKVRGRAELRVRLETLILPDGTTKAFTAGITGLDSTTGESIDPEGKIKGKGGAMNDVKNIATSAGVGALAGGAIGGLTTIGTSGDLGSEGANVIRRPAVGSGVGLLGGAAGMFVVSLFLRGPDAIIAKGTDTEMVLDVPLRFAASELSSHTNASPNSDRNESGLIKRPPLQ